MATIGAGISLRGIAHEDFHYPFLLDSGITRSDEGKAVALDTSAANTVKLATTGLRVLGQLVIVEDRTVEGVLVGTVALKGGVQFATTGTVAVGDEVVGSTTAGSVRKAVATADHTTSETRGSNVVVEVGTGTAVVVLL